MLSRSFHPSDDSFDWLIAKQHSATPISRCCVVHAQLSVHFIWPKMGKRRQSRLQKPQRQMH